MQGRKEAGKYGIFAPLRWFLEMDHRTKVRVTENSAGKFPFDAVPILR